MPLLDGHQQGLPGQDRAGATPGENTGGHGDGTTEDGPEDALVAHEMNVVTEPVTNLWASGNSSGMTVRARSRAPPM